MQSGYACTAQHRLTAHFCLGDWRMEIYLPNPPVLPCKRSVPVAPPPPTFGSSGLVLWTVPDVITPTDLLWMWRRQEQSTAGLWGSASGLEDRVSIQISPLPWTKQAVDRHSEGTA